MLYETELEMTDRHIRDGERRIADQHAVIERLRRLGADTELAEQLLASLHEAMRNHLAHRARILDA